LFLDIASIDKIKIFFSFIIYCDTMSMYLTEHHKVELKRGHALSFRFYCDSVKYVTP